MKNNEKTFGTTRVGNIAVDMIIACLAHYRKFHKRVEFINLSANFWNEFRKWMGKNAPEKEFTDDGIAFNHGGKDVIIRKGHRFMTKNLEVQLHKEKIAEA